MFEGLTNDDISKALSELITCLGVKEDKPFDSLITFLEKKEIEKCVQEIAIRLDLPIRINLSYVSKDYRPENTEGFRSSSLVRTDWRGRGVEGIIAQVSIPQNLPMFGTSGLQGYQIQVRVSENCCDYPATFVAIMAHELSHVLLASLWHPKKDSELHTDLVPVLLGFRGIVRQGRKKIDTTTNADTTTTHTTTYGYLTDSQFEFACSNVAEILKGHQQDKEVLIKSVKQLRSKLAKAARSIAAFRDYFDYLDRFPPAKMKPEHARRVVDLHAQDYSRAWENQISVVKSNQETAESFVRHLNHYTSSAVEHLKNHVRGVELATADLQNITETITHDKRILGKYVGLIYRLRRAILSHCKLKK